MQAIQAVIEAVYNFLWGDLVRIPLPGGSSLGLSLLVLILVPAGVYFTVRTRKTTSRATAKATSRGCRP